ncbi:MAG: hypothetical protein A2083_03850 [Gemmatimonadetes bacterium GWC2_71_9]|nr:MAG: hypothetical protein A2083_03850 [Gemmatimonadetes bacterium GWC2_71_9]
MRRLLLVLALALVGATPLALVGATPLAAQSNTAEMLQRAIGLYEDLEVERALVILRQILSPASPFEVSPQQRVEAYKYFGAALALQPGQIKRDSAITFFRAALERDPFVDLDPQTFSPIQLQAFSEARNRTFGVGARPLTADTLDPRSGQLTFRGLTSHTAELRVELRAGGTTRHVLFEGENEGLREIPWNGLLTDGMIAPAGRYELAVIGRSRLIPVADTVSVFFEVAHLHPPLEDTLPPLRPQDLLPEQHPASAATADLLKGIGVAAAALLIQTALPSGDLGGGRTALSGAVAGAGTVAGVVAFFVRQSHRSIPANIAENERHRAERDATNAAIGRRNAERLRETRLVITPATGVGR